MPLRGSDVRCRPTHGKRGVLGLNDFHSIGRLRNLSINHSFPRTRDRIGMAAEAECRHNDDTHPLRWRGCSLSRSWLHRCGPPGAVALSLLVGGCNTARPGPGGRNSVEMRLSLLTPDGYSCARNRIDVSAAGVVVMSHKRFWPWRHRSRPANALQGWYDIEPLSSFRRRVPMPTETRYVRIDVTWVSLLGRGRLDIPSIPVNREKAVTRGKGMGSQDALVPSPHPSQWHLSALANFGPWKYRSTIREFSLRGSQIPSQGLLLTNYYKIRRTTARLGMSYPGREALLCGLMNFGCRYGVLRGRARLASKNVVGSRFLNC